MHADRRFWRSIRFKLVAVSLLLILFSLELIGAYFVRTLTTSLLQNETQTVENQAHLMSILVAPEMGSPGKRTLDSVSSMLSSLPQYLNGAVYILNRDGYVEDTSAGGALIGQKRTDSVSTQALLQHRTVAAIRFDPLSNEHLLDVAAPMSTNGRFVGVVEYVVPIQTIYNTVREVTRIFYTGSALVLVLAAILGIVLARIITRPILDVTRQARVLADGDFSRRVRVGGDDEFGDLAMAINDLTAKLEDALQSNLREQERLRAVMTSMGDGVVAFDIELTPIFLNEAARHMLRLSSDKDAVEKMELMSEDLGDAVGKRVLVREMGETILHIHVTAIYQDGQKEGYVAVLRDVTEQEKLNRSRRDFVANVSHELRTPLTSVKSYIEAMRDLTAEEEEVRQDFLHVVGEETDRMVRLTRDLLQLSGLERQGQVGEQKPILLEEWLTSARQRFRISASSRSIDLQFGPIPSGTVLGNHDMLDRVLDNLLSNALKYTPPGGVVRVEARVVDEQHVEVAVQDTGIGIPEEDLPHVFERFYRVDKGRSRRSGGTGLGLALAREITERHGGLIRIESEPDVGTTVRLTLPFQREEVSS